MGRASFTGQFPWPRKPAPATQKCLRKDKTLDPSITSVARDVDPGKTAWITILALSLSSSMTFTIRFHLSEPQLSYL